ncbi:hypothetical protein CKAH01_00261 [Colletotrichum kahawae]|uniref:Uncharacterized protein n=1 Tax=Colletotrichum kahawae TaxID=34407 RepID=A0AAD9YUR0_COLKA|nr:hypothetical protein CKAH01_00261 [Colletotrichum kahawae]
MAWPGPSQQAVAASNASWLSAASPQLDRLIFLSLRVHIRTPATSQAASVDASKASIATQRNATQRSAVQCGAVQCSKQERKRKTRHTRLASTLDNPPNQATSPISTIPRTPVDLLHFPQF